MRGLSIIFLVGAAVSGAAQAEPPLYPTQDCSKAVTQYDLDTCADANDQAADKALNETYKKLLAQQPDEASAAHLRDAERVWISYRDKACAKAVGPQADGGSIWPMEMSNCLEEKTAARLRELKRNLVSRF